MSGRATGVRHHSPARRAARHVVDILSEPRDPLYLLSVLHVYQLLHSLHVYLSLLWWGVIASTISCRGACSARRGAARRLSARSGAGGVPSSCAGEARRSAASIVESWFSSRPIARARQLLLCLVPRLGSDRAKCDVRRSVVGGARHSGGLGVRACVLTPASAAYWAGPVRPFYFGLVLL